MSCSQRLHNKYYVNLSGPGAEKNFKNFKKTIDKKTNVWYYKTIREKENSKPAGQFGHSPQSRRTQ